MLRVKILACKSDALSAFQRSKTKAENESGCVIQRLRQDGGVPTAPATPTRCLANGPRSSLRAPIAASAPPPAAAAPAAPVSAPAFDLSVTPTARGFSTPAILQRLLRFESVTLQTPMPQLNYAQSAADTPSSTPTPPPPAHRYDPLSPDSVNFLNDNPFEALLGDVEALICLVAEEIDASGSDIRLPSFSLRNHRKAACDIDSEHWRRKEQGEFSFLLDNYKCFHFIDHKDIPAGAKVLGVRFVYRRKKDQWDRVHSYKVRLVVQGFDQHPSIDFCETFAIVAKFTAIRILGAGSVLKLDRALWPSAGRLRLESLDPCLLFKEINRVEGWLKAEYGIKDLGEAKFILGIQVHRRPDGSIFP
ncbi:hypothetical protein JCM8547_000680 [Rhodosporidiobolus lusitaniae]